MTYEHQEYPKYLYHPTLAPTGRLCNSTAETVGLAQAGWVDTPAKFPRTVALAGGGRRLDLETGKRVVALRERILRDFRKSDWEAIGLLTGQSAIIEGHDRLLRSLYFNDEDYPGNALTVLRAIVEADPPAVNVIEQYTNDHYPAADPVITAPTADAETEPNTPAHDFDIALSFAGEDRAYVEQVAEHLKIAGIKVFYDAFEKATLWGQNLADHLADVYGRRSRFVIIFASKHYAEKAWPTLERQAAQARAIKERQVVVLPARFDQTEIPGLLSTVGYVDLTTTPVAEFVALILERLGNAA
jgi:hypothetical protein